MLAAFLATLVLVPAVAYLLPETAFHRLMTRTFWVCVIVALLVGRGRIRTWPAGLRRLGLRGPRPVRRMLLGAAASILLLAAVLGFSWLTGGRRIIDGLVLGWPPRFFKAILIGGGVGVVEELVWRGYLRGRMGATGSSLAYAAMHYFRPLKGSAPVGGSYDPLLAIRRFPEMLQSWEQPHAVLLGMTTLFLFGLALCHLRQRTGSLYPGIGAHAGFVFAIELYRDFIYPQAVGSEWIFGGTRLHDGLVGMLAMVVFAWAVGRVPVSQETRAPEDTQWQYPSWSSSRT
ncbi:MAG: lysostaphin resistance A-like protein [Acidobacteriota bacterium]